MTTADVLVLGAGGAGLMCATEAAKRGRSVIVLDHTAKIGGKILISGGGRCNFTNVGASSVNYVSNNPHFCKSALARYGPEDFIELVKKHRIPFHEKKLGQLFCDRSARDIVTLLEVEAAEAGVAVRLGQKIVEVNCEETGEFRFSVRTDAGRFQSKSLVLATGGLSIPKLGATGFGYDLARKFGHAIVETAPALDGFVLSGAEQTAFAAVSGVSADCSMQAGGVSFRENVLITHSGLSGPASLQASLYWRTGADVLIDWLPDRHESGFLVQRKSRQEKTLLSNVLAAWLPKSLTTVLLARALGPDRSDGPILEFSDRTLTDLENRLHRWSFRPEKTVGYSKAEVTRGGVDTNELSSQTMESKRVRGLYFIGEVMDVTGWLGGYNFQWAWASGFAAGQSV